MPEVKLPYNPDNYMIPSAISAWFALINEDGSLGQYYDLGNVSEISLGLEDTYLDHKSSRLGIQATDKTVITDLDGNVNMTLDELVGNNLIQLFRPSTLPDAAAVYDVLDQRRIRLTGTTAVVIDSSAVETSAIDYLDLTIECVRDNTGATTYVDTTDYVITAAAGTGTARTPATIARSGTGSATADGSEVVVKYTYNREATEYRIQEGAILEGALRLQCLNRIGPLFAWEFPFVSTTIAGDIAINPAEFMSVAFTWKVLTPGDGIRGRFFLFDEFLKLTSSALATCA